MRRSPLLTTVAALLACLTAPAVVCAQAEFTVFREFNPPAVPRSPNSMIEGSDGNFYGTTWDGGAWRYGTVFRMTPDGVVTPLHEFGEVEGNPSFSSSLLLASDDNFYGTTYHGIFRVTPDGRMTMLHWFTRDEEGLPVAPMQGTDGNIYGATLQVAYKMTTAGVFTILRRFDGQPPSLDPGLCYDLVQGPDGNFYGVSSGGRFNSGTFFRLSPDGTLAVLHDFDGSGGVWRPENLVLARDGNFYGPIGSAIVRITPLGEATKVFSFIPNWINEHAMRDLIAAPDGSIYVPTFRYSGTESVFRIASDYSVSLVHTFATGTEGQNIRLGFARADGSLFGMAGYSGPTGNGTVFKLTPAGVLTVLSAFSDYATRTYPGLFGHADDGTLYGLSGGGYGSSEPQKLFSLARDGVLTWLHTFTESEVKVVYSISRATDGSFYGIAYGEDSRATAFRVTPDGAVGAMHRFADSDPTGQYPSALIQGVDGNFYGTSAGGAFGLGTVFRMTPDGSLSVLHDFSGGTADGSWPQASVVQAPDGTLYGTTSRGGTTGYGTVYRIAPDGLFSLLASVYSHDGDYSANPMPGVMLASDGNLYGVVPHGKASRSEVFRLTPSGVFTVLFRFGGTYYIPSHPPIQAQDGNLYGLDVPSGFPSAPKYGIYKISLADGHYESLTITGETRIVPYGLLSGGDEGYLYGVSSNGALFRLKVPMPAPMVVDTPQPEQTMTQPFAISGWALDLAATLSPITGVDAVHVWAYPNDGRAPMFVGAAQYGFSRPDVKAIFGNRFLDTGYQLTVDTLSAGTYQLAVFARRAVTYEFDVARTVTVTVASQPWIVLDTPAADVEVGPSFTISGWALDTGSASGTGIDAVHLYAYPESGAPIFLGAATYGGSRPDVGAIFGARFTNSAYNFSVGSGALASGRYQLVAFARSSASGTFSAQTRAITVRAGNPLMFVDAPAGAIVSMPFTISGWAVDTDAPSGTGVDAIHVWAFSSSGMPVFLGAAPYGLARPDVGAYLGASRFTNSGYSLSATGLSPGVWQLVIFTRSTVTGTFNQARVVPVTVH